MKKFILDTDIGADSDDMVAFSYLLKKMRDGECKLKAVTLCTARKSAAGAAKALIDEYGYKIPIGQYTGNPLKCDETDNYAEKTAEKHGTKDYKSTINAVDSIRKILSDSDEKVDIICIGPSVNIRDFIQSGADEFSPLSGIDLTKEKIGKMYVMGGGFFGNGKVIDNENFVEWNIEQDIESAKYVTENFPCKIVFCPFETGAVVATFLGSTSGVAKDSMEFFFSECDRRDGKNYVSDPLRTRPSWDPLTCMVALYEENFELSPFGKVSFDDNGKSTFTPEINGKHRYLLCKKNLKQSEKNLNDYLSAK